MECRGDRKIIRLVLQIEPLLVLLKRHGYLQKEHVLKKNYVLSKERCEAVPGSTVLPDDARLVDAPP